MLTLKTKTARFEWVDDDVESVVTLSSEDDQETLVRKLKRIVTLVEGESVGLAPAHVLPPRMGEIGHYGGVDIAPQTGNGWAAFAATAPPELPARLEGEVELINPGEGGE